MRISSCGGGEVGSETVDDGRDLGRWNVGFMGEGGWVFDMHFCI